MLACLLASGCTARGWYQGMQHSQDSPCRNLPVGQQQECRQEARGPDYDRYREELEAARRPD